MNQNAEHSAVNDAVHGQFLRKVWKLITPYWKSEEKAKAWLLLLTVIGLSLVGVALQVWFNSWNRDMYNSLQDKQYDTFVHLILYFCVIATVSILVGVLRIYLTQMLTIRWRRWLTEKHFKKWLGHKNYYQLERQGGTDNPDQRLTEDLRSFTSDTLSIGLGLISNIVSLVSFSVILWGISGSIEVFGITIPGYMFWAAVLYALAGSLITHLLGRRLIRLSNRQQRYEADLRFGLVRLRENAETIALLDGEPVENQRLSARFGQVWSNYWEIMRVQKRMNIFTNGYAQIANIFPVVVAAPRYFAGKLELGGLMQVANAFGNVQESLSWFIDAYVSLAAWRATCDRLLSFRAAMDANEQRSSGIQVNHAGSALQISDLGLKLQSGRQLFEGASLNVAAGERVLLSGRSGSGKSTLLRAMGNLLSEGQGRIDMPAGRSLFMPQKPYLPIGSLREALSYPQPVEAYTPGQYEQVLNTCRLPHLIERLDESNHWQSLLSPGEQQRLAFARALLYAPQWLYLDEATSAMDEEDEAALYQALIDELPGLTLVSVGHRSSLKRFHSRHIRLEGGHLVTQPMGAPSPV
ncbi:MAG: ABC transporter ATP-binding protein/permease [Pseudomonas sp.]|uniref:ABC transporter ATP-binding protein/permease n=1 Tax=Pseudomonas abieticivorans TaxID=2931382 RepID=UPI0020BE70FA|nr:ABC transporter ATP-binding protein/permease [Pseudomonas sp. PIA16]MDE1166919.1 ABC transporter ATP-binding protein/permease [Pseudomonas sp.]